MDKTKATLASGFPEVAAQWHPTLNGELTADDVTPFSSKSPSWLCEKGHVWEAAVANRTRRGDGCPYCSGRRVLTGFNDLATLDPVLAAEWHPTRNGDRSPATTALNSNTLTWWQCSACAHEWTATVGNRHKRGCPACAGRVISSGRNDLATTYPHLTAEWHPTRNGKLTPENVSAGQATSPWWLCKQGHEWTATIYARAKAGQGCPYCSGRYVIPNQNGLSQTHPELTDEWHPEKNKQTPDEVKAGSHYRATWQCNEGHVWATSVKERTRPNRAETGKRASGCPTCSAARNTSYAEQELASFLATLTTVRQTERGVLPMHELDIYLPDHNLAVEFNGLYWHSDAVRKDKAVHQKKWQAAKDAGIQLIQIWEDEWLRNPEQVKRMLAHKIGVSYGEERKVMARKTTVVSVTKSVAERFYNTHHIQGFASASHYLALRDINGENVAVLALRNEAGTDGKTLNIIRYATSAIVPGGFTKLLKHAERAYQPEKFITFSDNCVSDGGLYANNGFTADKTLPPDYMYVVRGERKHKFGYRLKRFRNDPNLKWEEGLTERELAKLNGLHRIWDAGKTRWVKHLRN